MVAVAGWLIIPDEIAHTSLGYYAELRKLDIDLHKYYMSERMRRSVSWEEAERDWARNHERDFDVNFKKRLPVISDRLHDFDLVSLRHQHVSELVYGVAV